MEQLPKLCSAILNALVDLRLLAQNSHISKGNPNVEQVSPLFVQFQTNTARIARNVGKRLGIFQKLTE